MRSSGTEEETSPRRVALAGQEREGGRRSVCTSRVGCSDAPHTLPRISGYATRDVAASASELEGGDASAGADKPA